MTLLDYIKKVAMPDMGIHKSFEKVVDLVYQAELDGEPAFAHDRFSDVRKRVRLALPFQCDDIEKYNHHLDVIESAALTHDHQNHGFDNSERLAELRPKLVTADEIEVGTQDWWQA